MKRYSLVNFLYNFVRRGGYGKLVQRELEAPRTLVDYASGSLAAFQPMPSRCKFLDPFLVMNFCVFYSMCFFCLHIKYEE